MTGDEEVRAGLGRSEVGWIPGDAQHPLAHERAVGGRRHHRAPQRADVGVPLPVRRNSGHVLLQDVARFAIRGKDGGHRREIGRDLVPTHPVAVHQHTPIAEVIGARIVEGVQQLAGEAVETGRQQRSPESPGRDDDRVERLTVHPPARLQVADRRPELNPLRHSESVGVRAQIVVNLLGQWMQVMRRRRRVIRKGGHCATGVGAHAGPDTTVCSRSVPLPTEVIARLEYAHVESGFDGVLRRHQTTRAGADHRDARPHVEPYHAHPLPFGVRSLCRRPSGHTTVIIQHLV